MNKNFKIKNISCSTSGGGTIAKLRCYIVKMLCYIDVNPNTSKADKLIPPVITRYITKRIS